MRLCSSLAGTQKNSAVAATVEASIAVRALTRPVRAIELIRWRVAMTRNNGRGHALANPNVANGLLFWGEWSPHGINDPFSISSAHA